MSCPFVDVSGAATGAGTIVGVYVVVAVCPRASEIV